MDAGVRRGCTVGVVLRTRPLPPWISRNSDGERVVVAEFSDLDALLRWHDSAEYQALIALREAGAEVVLTAYRT